MPSYKQWNILLVRFPFTDLSSSKVRPVLVLRDQEGDDIICLAISSQTEGKKNTYLLDDSEYVTSPLPIPSVVRIATIMTLHRSLIVKKWSSVTLESFKAIRSLARAYIFGQ